MHVHRGKACTRVMLAHTPGPTLHQGRACTCTSPPLHYGCPCTCTRVWLAPGLLLHLRTALPAARGGPIPVPPATPSYPRHLADGHDVAGAGAGLGTRRQRQRQPEVPDGARPVFPHQHVLAAQVPVHHAGLVQAWEVGLGGGVCHRMGRGTPSQRPGELGARVAALTVAPELLVQESEAAGEGESQAHAAGPRPHVLLQEMSQGALGTRVETRVGTRGSSPTPTPRARTHLPPSACRGTPPSGAGTGTAQPAWASRAHTCATPAAHAHARAPPRATLPHPPAPRAHPSLPLTAGYSWRTRSPPRARGPAPRVPSSRATLSCSIRGNPCTARSAAKRPAAPATKALMATGRCCRVPRHTAEKRPVCSTCRHPQHPWVPVVTPQVSPLGEGIPRGVG